ncbi:DUF3617 domain-containing protein [Sphingomonas sp. CFBP 8760]|uniref:DUF3617 domain-containing protein n=1 Tax=Sphingomonas sp. CFBP 8760 TaxID=2775282 RepID=UPI001782E660|nr:hypothetical protein [Sphingomonas sp. CFBP 8760]MBD8546753.1 hypothetical protein [Sphingomonas sp. CFBP 8760]
MIRVLALAATLAIGLQATGTTQDAAMPSDDAEILVTGKRMNAIRLEYRGDAQRWICFPRVKPEDERLGRVMCAALRVCVKGGSRARTAARNCLYAAMDRYQTVAVAEVALGLRPPAPEATGTPPLAGEWEFQGVRTALVAGKAMSETPYGERKCIIAAALEPMVQNLMGVPILRDASPECVPLLRTIGGGGIEASVRCSYKGVQTVQRLTGRYEGERIRWEDRRTPLNVSDGMAVEIRYLVEGRRVGECGAGEQGAR